MQYRHVDNGSRNLFGSLANSVSAAAPQPLASAASGSALSGNAPSGPNLIGNVGGAAPRNTGSGFGTPAPPPPWLEIMFQESLCEEFRLMAIYELRSSAFLKPVLMNSLGFMLVSRRAGLPLDVYLLRTIELQRCSAGEQLMLHRAMIPRW